MLTLEQFIEQFDAGSVVRCRTVEEQEAVYRFLEENGYTLYQWEKEFLYEDLQAEKERKHRSYNMPGLEEDEDEETGEVTKLVTTWARGSETTRIEYDEISHLISGVFEGPDNLEIAGVFESIYGGM